MGLIAGCGYVCGTFPVFDFASPSNKEGLIHKLASTGITYRNFYMKQAWAIFPKGRVSPDEAREASYDGYHRLIQQSDALEAAKKAYLEAKGKVVLSCSYGRDRTGVASLLIEAYLGWDKRRMLIDYAISYFRLSHLLKGMDEDNLGRNYGNIISPIRFWDAFAVPGE